MQQPKIIYEDDIVIVCHKPAGLATQTRRLGQPDMESFLKNHVALAGNSTGKGVLPYIGIVHRLDQPVEGVMVFAKTPKAAADLSDQVRTHSFGKKYYALVQLPENVAYFTKASGLPESGTLEDWILFEKAKNTSAVVPEKTGGAKRGILDYQVLGQKNARALLDITLHTGRHHQIRVQLAHLGTPICGDRKYGKAVSGSPALCSYHIDFEHPVDGRRMAFEIVPENVLFHGFEPYVKP